MSTKNNYNLAMYIYQIYDCINAIDDFTFGVNKNIFIQDRNVHTCVNMMIQVIGENINKIKKDFVYIVKEFNDFPWDAVYGFRNKISHEYFSVKPHRTWETVQYGIPDLKRVLNEICNTYPEIQSNIDNIRQDKKEEFILLLKSSPLEIAKIPYHEQTKELVDIAIDECKNFPGVNPSDLTKFIKPELRDMVLECKGYWGIEFPSNDHVWRDE